MNIYEMDRVKTSDRLRGLYAYIYRLMLDEEWAREIMNRNRLIRFVWDNYNENENAESITRLQRKAIENNPHLDTENNIKLRANRETTTRQVMKEI